MGEIERRRWGRIAAALVVLLAVAAAAALAVLRAQPKPAPTDGGPAMGTVAGPDTSGVRSYDSKRLGFRFRYPGDWRLTESGAAEAPEGDYLTLTLLPSRLPGDASAVRPVVVEIVPDPQGFSADAVVRMKWGSAPATMTVATQTVEIAGTKGVEVVVTDTESGPKTLYSYEAIGTIPGRMFRLSFSATKRSQLDAVAGSVREIVGSLETY